MKGRLRYAYLDEAPVVFDDVEAWEYYGHWRPLNISDARAKARLLTKSEFDDYAGPDLPALPEVAFI